MKAILPTTICVILLSCGSNKERNSTEMTAKPIAGTWRLLSGTIIEKGDTTITDYTQDKSFIKVINDTHFAFLQHSIRNEKDSTVFGAGGGSYTLKDSSYTEHLEYCSSPEWEGHEFHFTVSFNGDTLVQSGFENVPEAGVSRVNIEKYVRLK